MSDTDGECASNRGRSDPESSCPHSSLVDSTINLTSGSRGNTEPSSPNLDYESTPRVNNQYERESLSTRFDSPNNMTVSDSQTEIRRGTCRADDVSGPAPYKGMLVEYSGAPLVETGPNTQGGQF